MPPRKPKGQNNNNNNKSMKRQRGSGSGGYAQPKSNNSLDLTSIMALQSGSIDPAMLMMLKNQGGSSSQSLLPLLMASNGSSGAATTSKAPSTSIDPTMMALMASMGGGDGGNNDLLTMMLLQRHQQQQALATASVPASLDDEEDQASRQEGMATGKVLQDTCDQIDDDAAALATLQARDSYRDEHLDSFMERIPTQYSTYKEALEACDAECTVLQAAKMGTPGRNLLQMMAATAKTSNDLAIKLAATAAAEATSTKMLNAFRAETMQECTVIVDPIGSSTTTIGATAKKTKVVAVEVDHKVSKADLVDITACFSASKVRAEVGDKPSDDDVASGSGRPTRRKKDKYIDNPLTVLNKLFLLIPKGAREGLGAKLGKDVTIPPVFNRGTQPLRDVITKQISSKVEEKDITAFIKKFKIYTGSTRPDTLAKVVGDVIWILAEVVNESGCDDCKISTTMFLNPL